MFLRELCFFRILVAVIALAPIGRLNTHTHEFDLATPSSRLDESFARGGSPWYLGHPANRVRRSHWVTLLANSEIPPSVFLPIQSNNPKDLATGKLLVASRNLGDPNFAKTVVLLVHYDAEGVVGLILNRCTYVPLSRVFEGFNGAKQRLDPVYLGGPVERTAAFGLLQSPTKVEGAEHIFGAVYLVSTKALFEQTIAARPDPNIFHVYLGYAGWNAEQLQREVQLGSWFIFPRDARTVFNSNPDSLWPQMIRKTELKLATSEPHDAGHSSEAPALDIALRSPRAYLGHPRAATAMSTLAR